MTGGKRLQFDDEAWSVINLLRQERRRSEAFADLLVMVIPPTSRTSSASVLAKRQ